MPDTPIIALRQVSKSFGSLEVLREVSLDFQAGKTTVVIGPSGVGKSVLLKLIVGLLRPDEGEVHFEGQRIDNRREHELTELRTQIGFLFQMGALFDSMTVGENVQFPLVEHAAHMGPAERARRCAEVLDLVDMDGSEQKMPVELSGGQRKRVALARAVALHPRVICYDEPTTGLDPIRSDEIDELIVKLQRELQATSLVVTHDMHSAETIADRIVMLYDGTVIADASPADLQHHPEPIVQRFIRGRGDGEEAQTMAGRDEP